MNFTPEEATEYELRKGDVLLSEASGSPNEVGKPALWRDEISGCCFQNTLIRVRSAEVSPAYLYWHFYKDAMTGAFGRAARGVGIHHLGAKGMHDWPIAVAPREEQDRIVAELEKQFTRIDAASAALKRVLHNTRLYRRAFLQHAVLGGGGPVNDLPAGWQWITASDVLTFITSGSRGWSKHYSDSGPLFIRIGNLEHDDVALDLRNRQHVIPPAGTEGTRTRLQPNDIVVSITADVGMVALIPSDIGEAYINQHIALARPSNEVDPRWLAWCFTSPVVKSQLRSFDRGATKVGLGLDDIRRARLPLPPFADQVRIADEIERRVSVAQHVGDEVKSALDVAGQLKRSVLKNAFAGKLTAGSNYSHIGLTREIAAQA